MKTPMRAALYARVSTDEQINGTSLDEQVEVCTDEIRRQGWTLDPAQYQSAVGGSPEPALLPSFGFEVREHLEAA